MFQSTFICVTSCSLFHWISFYFVFLCFIIRKGFATYPEPWRSRRAHCACERLLKNLENVSKGFMKLALCTEANKGIGHDFLVRLLVILEFASEKKKKKKECFLCWSLFDSGPKNSTLSVVQSQHCQSKTVESMSVLNERYFTGMVLNYFELCFIKWLYEITV